MLEDLLTIFMSGENMILTILFFTLLIAIYSIFIYFFYRFLAKKDLISLNLNQYNIYKNGAIMKFFAAIFYIIEYIVLLPIVTTVWFTFLSILVLMLSEGLETQTALIVSAALVAAVRITAYIKEDLSKDLAKMLPFSLLSLAITSEVVFFSASALTKRISEIPNLFDQLPYFLIFIVCVELFMRIIGFIFGSINIAKRIRTEASVIEETSEIEEEA